MFLMPDNHPLEIAHGHSFKNRAEVTASDLCGCFFCLAIFSPDSIQEWLKEQDGKETAFCPRCGIDSVIGSASGFPITTEFMREMRRRWFSDVADVPADFFAQKPATDSD